MHDSGLVNDSFQRAFPELCLPDSAKYLSSKDAAVIQKSVRAELSGLIKSKAEFMLGNGEKIALADAGHIREICTLPTFFPEKIPGTAPRLIDLVAR